MVSVEVFAPSRNEAHILKAMYSWYRQRLGNVCFTILDLGSNDGTLEFANEVGIRVLHQPEEKFRDRTNMDFKNNIFKDSTADYFIVQDLDEFLEVDDLILESSKCSKVVAECWDMIGEGQREIGPSIVRGNRLPLYDKPMMYKRSHVKEINLTPGGHFGETIYCRDVVQPIVIRRPMYHFNRLGADYVVEKYQSRKARLSEENIQKGWGVQYCLNEDEIRLQHDQLFKKSIQVLPTNSYFASDFNPLEMVVTLYRQFFGAIARTIFDVGSRDGVDAKWLAGKLHAQRIVAIEADPIAAANIAKKFPKFEVINIAVSDFQGESEFTRLVSHNADIRGSSSIYSNRINEWDVPKERIRVRVNTLKGVIDEIGGIFDQIDVMKIDVEGYSFQALSGLEEMIDRVRLFHIESEMDNIHENHVDSVGIFRFMKERSFIPVSIQNNWEKGLYDQIWINPNLVNYQKDSVVKFPIQFNV